MSCLLFYLFLIFYNGFFVIYGELIPGNPIKITQGDYPLIFLSDDKSSYNIISAGKIIVLEKDGRAEKDMINFDLNLPPLELIKDESNCYYLISGNYWYDLNFNSNHEIKEITNKRNISSGQYYFELSSKYEFGVDFFGFIEENGKIYDQNIKKDQRTNINPNEIVLYAYFEEKLYFYYFTLKKFFSFIITMDNHISCILVTSAVYACAYTKENAIYIGIFSLCYQNKDDEDNNYIFNDINKINDFSIHDFAILTEVTTDTENLKILCARNKDTKLFSCKELKIKVDNINIKCDKAPNTPNLEESHNLNIYLPTLSFHVDNCYFTGFHSEYLYCCGG